MNLTQGHIRPGLVMKLEDISKGIIKVSCPGLFSDEDEPDKLPPVFPFFPGRANCFSQVSVDDEVWVLFFNDNPQELYYFRKDNFSEPLADILKEEYKDLEVLCCKESGMGYAQIYFADGTGWIIQNDKQVMQFSPDGFVRITNGSKHRVIEINDDNISLGSEEKSAHPAALGDKVVDSLKKLDKVLTTVANAAQGNPYTINIGVALNAVQSTFSESIDSITSNHVTLD